MAKRRRLDPVPQVDLAAPEQKSALPPIGAPIARVAQDTAREAAFEELRSALTEARAEGRLIQKLPLDAVHLDHLLRDRIALDEAALVPLMESLRARGQQVPIEVTALGEGRFGLIAGWRRMAALKRLHAETGEARFATVLALLRSPETAGDAYLAMVEENEIRLGLSHYERARIVLRAVEAGVSPPPRSRCKSCSRMARARGAQKSARFWGWSKRWTGPCAFPPIWASGWVCGLPRRSKPIPVSQTACAAILPPPPPRLPRPNVCCWTRRCARPRPRQRQHPTPCRLPLLGALLARPQSPLPCQEARRRNRPALHQRGLILRPVWCWTSRAVISSPC